MSDALLSVRELAVRFDAPRGAFVRAVDGVSFEIEPGSALGLVGESGSGKTTVARAIVGLQAPSAGSITLHGAPLGSVESGASRARRRHVQMVFQDPYSSLDPRRTTAEIVAEPLAIHGLLKPRERRLRALAALDACGLEAGFFRCYPHQMSGGQRQRVAIARALVVEPELVVCDEPTSALDVSVRAQIVNLLCELRARFGLAYLFISHDLAVVRRVCERVAVMYFGKLVEVGSREQVFGAPQHPYTRALLAAVPCADPAQPSTHVPLAGDPPSPSRPPSGCAFHPRCADRVRVAGDLCAREAPLLLPDATMTTASACHLRRGE